MTEAEAVAPVRMRDDGHRLGSALGVVARDLAHHRLFSVGDDGGGHSYAASFDELAGNGILGMELCRLAPGAHTSGQRLLAEILVYVVAGRGWSELRQADDAPVQRVEWREGDLLAIPANAWHQHFNTDGMAPARHLVFSNRPSVRSFLGSTAPLTRSPFRFVDRYNGQEDYWDVWDLSEDGSVVTHVIRDVRSERLTVCVDRGRSVSGRCYRMGGHRTLAVSLVEMAHRGHVARHRHLVEEGIYVLAGRGRTIITADDGRETTFRWRAGDLFSPPLGCWHQHVCEAKAHDTTRLLVVRDRALERAFASPDEALSTVIPVRFPTLIEPDYTDVETSPAPPVRRRQDDDRDAAGVRL